MPRDIDTSPTPKPSRRRLLKAGIASGVLLAGGSVIAFVRTRGYDLEKERAAKLIVLEPWQIIVVEAIARRIAAADVEGDPTIPTSDDVDVAGFIDAYLAEMHPDLQRDLLRLVGYIEHLAPLGSGFSSRFTRLSPGDQDSVLAALEASGQDLLRGGFAGIKALVFMGYYRDARTWKIMGYDGPLLKRPEGGWPR